MLLSVSCREHHRACFTWNGGLAMIAAYESRGGGSSDESSREVGIAVAARRRGRGVCAGVRLNAEPSRDCPRLSVAVGLPLRSRSVWCHTRPEYQAWAIPCGGTNPAVMRAFDPSRGVLSDGEQVEPCACESERPPARRPVRELVLGLVLLRAPSAWPFSGDSIGWPSGVGLKARMPRCDDATASGIRESPCGHSCRWGLNDPMWGCSALRASWSTPPPPVACSARTPGVEVESMTPRGRRTKAFHVKRPVDPATAMCVRDRVRRFPAKSRTSESLSGCRVHVES